MKNAVLSDGVLFFLRPFPGLADGITAENSAVVAHIFEVIPQIAKAESLENGYRVVSNCGADAGQTVHHLHFHILGGRQLTLEMA